MFGTLSAQQSTSTCLLPEATLIASASLYHGPDSQDFIYPMGRPTLEQRLEHPRPLALLVDAGNLGTLPPTVASLSLGER